MKRHSIAIWNGNIKTGSGSLTTQSGVLDKNPYSFLTRFENEDGRAGTNPEELLAAGHAGCFTMALAFMLEGAGFSADEIQTTATVDMHPVDGQPTITGIELDMQAKIPGIDDTTFQGIATNAKANCVVSRALSVPVTLKAVLL